MSIAGLKPLQSGLIQLSVMNGRIRGPRQLVPACLAGYPTIDPALRQLSSRYIPMQARVPNLDIIRVHKLGRLP